ncbi:MAG: hypothetical protein ACK5P0_02520 [bacterium]|jgi:hypothetical protein
MMNTTQLEPRLQKLIDLGESGTDILHGELKNLMYEAEQELIEAQRIEEDNDYSDAMESMERKYWEGQCDALSHVYGLTYALAFAISERRSKQSNE